MHDWYSVYCSPPFVLDRDVSVDSQFINLILIGVPFSRMCLFARNVQM